MSPAPPDRPQWTPEIVVTPALALELIRSQFPGLEAADARPLGSGWDNTAYLVGDIVFRFPRRASAVGLLEREARVLPLLAGALPLPVPAPEWGGVPDSRYPWPFVGYRRLPGTPATEAPLGEAQLVAAAAELGGCLAALHALPTERLDLPGDEIRRLDIKARAPLARERLASLAASRLIGDPGPWLRLLDEEPPRPRAAGVPVHGDLYARHLLVGKGGRLCGIIDWGDVHAGDPAVDLSVMWGFLPAAARGVFLRAYVPVDEATLRLARLRAVIHSIGVASYAHSVGDAPLLAAGLTAMRHTLEGSPPSASAGH